MVLGIGTDIVEIDRIRDMIERHGDNFLNRCFTADEIAYAAKHRDAAVRYAGRWAAKEAVVKALGTGFVKGITFHDIEILPLHTGAPRIELSGEAAAVAAGLGIRSVLITISHARNYATATAIGLAEPASESPAPESPAPESPAPESPAPELPAPGQRVASEDASNSEPGPP